jgi:hypothetical protein
VRRGRVDARLAPPPPQVGNVSSRRFYVILGTAIVAICAALLVGHWRRGTTETEGTLLLPQLSAELGNVTSVTIRKGSAQPTVNLHKLADHWTVAQRGDYPADTAKLRNLLHAIASARVIEQKTADPANYHALGVEDPAAPEASGTEIAISTPAATQTIIVGKPSAGGSFVRFAQQARSLLIAPGLSPDGEARDWIDARLLDVRPDLVQQIQVKPAKGAAFKRKNQDFNALASLNALDVAAAGDLDFKSAATATVTLTDGAVITLAAATVQDRHWLTVTSTGDKELDQRARGRAYEIGATRYDAIFTP